MVKQINDSVLHSRTKTLTLENEFIFFENCKLDLKFFNFIPQLPLLSFFSLCTTFWLKTRQFNYTNLAGATETDTSSRSRGFVMGCDVTAKTHKFLL